jgi:D-cysteine desulfhydrase
MNEAEGWRAVEARLQRFPRLRWARGDTPIQALPRWSERCGSGSVHVKRDDLTGLAGGGNKARKLEFLVAEAIETHGADTLVTGGAAQSNHCRQTAAAAARTGLDCHLALGGHATGSPQGNLFLDELLGAHIHWCGDDRRGEQLPRIVAELEAEGSRPYLVP